jgi:hypothetical protein
MAFGKSTRLLDAGITPLIPFNCIPATATASGNVSINIPVALEYPNFSCIIPYIHCSGSSAFTLTVGFGGGPTTVYQMDIPANTPFIANFGMGVLSGQPGASKGKDVVVTMTGSGTNKLNVIYALVESFS